MSLPTFNGNSLNTTKIITTNVNWRTRAKRGIELAQIARRDGKKFVNDQLEHKVIQISGWVKADSPSDLQTELDNLYKNFSNTEGSLILESGRTFTATCERINIPDRPYNNSAVEFEMQFVVATGYAVGTQTTAGITLASGNQSATLSTTISGSAYNRPILRVNITGSSGQSPTNRYDITNSQTANTVTVSGTYNRGDEIVLNYDTFSASHNGGVQDYVGQFDSIEPTSVTFTIAASGTMPQEGATAQLEYNPRYY